MWYGNEILRGTPSISGVKYRWGIKNSCFSTNMWWLHARLAHAQTCAQSCHTKLTQTRSSANIYSLTNRATHVCNMQRRGWPLKTHTSPQMLRTPPHTCYHAEIRRSRSSGVGISWGGAKIGKRWALSLKICGWLTLYEHAHPHTLHTWGDSQEKLSLASRLLRSLKVITILSYIL